MPPPRLVMNLCHRMRVGQVRHFHRISISKRVVLFAPAKFTTPDLRHVLSATNLTFVRHSSVDGREQPEVLSSVNRESVDVTEDVIPEAPEVPIEEAVEQIAIVLNALGEQTLKSAGLGSFTPVGLVQNALEFMHVSCGLPWWGAIIAGTTILRLLVFPLVVTSQRHSARMNNNMPQIQAYQEKMTEARLHGNPYEMARASQELMLFMKTNQVNPLKGMILPAIQFPIFLSMFLGLRGMAMLPLESFKYGGLWWFSDITLPDQYFILPVVTVITLGVTLELGADIGKLASSGVGFGKYLKYGVRVLPLVVFPFIVNFPCAVCLYWASTNFISLGQVLFLKIPSVRNYFNIEEKRSVEKSKSKKKGVIGEFKESWKNMQVVKEIEERERLDHMKFTQAGRAAPVKTFKYNPKIVGGIKKDD
ncbi:hypothetical protein ACI65C_012669 [Semiaphis heraclei]